MYVWPGGMALRGHVEALGLILGALWLLKHLTEVLGP